MSEQHHDFPKTNISQVLIAILGGLIAPLLAIVLVVKLFIGIDEMQVQDADPAVATTSVEARIKPVAQVEVEAADEVKVSLSGDQVYQQNCLACHSSGAMGAPKFGDKAAWGPRIAQGYDTLVKHAIEGIRMMPARGGNAALSDDEVAAAVAYMANEAGANFAAPESATAPVAEASSDPAPAAPMAAAENEVKPVSAVAVAAEPVAGLGQAGEQTYQAVCAMCHNTGLMAAPKLGDPAGWAPRIAQGKDTLIKHAINGIRMMPAKGGNPGLSDAEVAAAVVYMANKAGAGF